MPKKILLGQLNSNGDCLLATVIARQIKEVDYPGCHLTWAVSDKCKQSALLNPYVDAIWEIPTRSVLTSHDEWDSFLCAVEQRKREGVFDIVFVTQIFGEAWMNYDGGIRSSMYNNYPNKITVPHQPILRLSESEIERVGEFAALHGLASYQHVILVECGPDSFKAALDPESAIRFAYDITHDDASVAVILSSRTKINSTRPSVIDGSVLSFRENAEITKYCDLFLGCASGISWLTTTDAAKKLNMILVISLNNVAFPSMVYDHEFFGLPTEHIIEIKSDNEAMTRLKNCVMAALSGSFANARQNYYRKVRLTDYGFLEKQLTMTLSKFQIAKAAGCLKRAFRRNGVRMILTAGFLKVVKTIAGLTINAALRPLGLGKRNRLTAEHK